MPASRHTTGHIADEAALAAAADRLILALDVPSAGSAFSLFEQLENSATPNPLRWVKVGLELYLAAGAGIVAALKERGYSVFLDLKLHDIPNTVAGAVRTLRSVEPDLLTVHASGGPAMLEAAAEAAAAPAARRPIRLLAVTVLTSMSQEQLPAIGVSDTPGNQALRLAELAWRCGVHGLVASAQDARALRHLLPDVHLVTPGIRSASGSHADQKRVATISEAIGAGANQLVVGRPITQAEDPRAALDAALQEIAGASRDSQAGTRP